MLYCGLALGGLVTTSWNNLEFFAASDNGGVTDYISAGLANPAAAALAFDVLFVGLSAQVFILVEGRRVGFSYPALAGFLVAGAVVAIAVAFPAFLIARQLRLSPQQGASASPSDRYSPRSALGVPE